MTAEDVEIEFVATKVYEQHGVPVETVLIRKVVWPAWWTLDDTLVLSVCPREVRYAVYRLLNELPPLLFRQRWNEIRASLREDEPSGGEIL